MSVPYAEVIGDPIAHSKSPLIHNFWLSKLGIEGEYRKTHVLAAALPDFLAGRRADPAWRGCNVTIPHKLAVLPLLDQLMPEVLSIGAVNTIVKSQDTEQLAGINTDYMGVLSALAGLDRERPVCLIGAGGAARAAVKALEIEGVRQMHIVARNEPAGQALLDAFAIEGKVYGFEQAETALRSCGTVINSSPLGMSGSSAMPDRLLDALSHTSAGAILFDMVYAPLETEFLRRARQLGRRPVDGLHMLIGQAAAAFQHFFGQPAPREHDAALRALLTA